MVTGPEAAYHWLMPISVRAPDIVRQRLQREPGIVAAYLFGSVARGTDREVSDVDVALLYDVAPRGYEQQPFQIEADLSAELGRPGQAVVLDHAPADLVHRVLRDGLLLLDRDPSLRIAFEVRARNVFFDMLPIWRRYRRQEGRHT